MEAIASNIDTLAHALLFSFLMFLFGRMLYALSHMRGVAKKNWQKYFTEFITAFFGALGVAAIMVILTGV